MKRLFGGVLRGMRHTRYVASGSPPLYRLVALGTLLSGIARAFDREATLSVAALTPSWFDWLFVGTTIAGGAMTLIGLYMTSENRYHATRLALSLQVERAGLSFMMTVAAVNIAALMFYYGEPPTGMGSWLLIVLWFWAWTRLWDIRKALKGLTR